jgi:hypothetical protein
MESYAMQMWIGYNQWNITNNTINKYTVASYDKEYTIAVMPTATFNTFCQIMIV